MNHRSHEDTLRLAELAKETEMGDEQIKQAYARYDSDPRVSGPDDLEAFTDAVRPLLLDYEQTFLSRPFTWPPPHDSTPQHSTSDSEGE